MKRLFSILLIVVCLSANAQYNPYKHSHKEGYKAIALFTTSIVLSAVGDGLNDEGFKTYGHLLNAASTGLLVASPFILDIDRSNWLFYIVSYSFIRAGLFDTSYNLTRGLPANYVGNSSFWDKGVAATKSTDSWLVAGKSFCLMVGWVIPIREF